MSPDSSKTLLESEHVLIKYGVDAQWHAVLKSGSTVVVAPTAAQAALQLCDLVYGQLVIALQRVKVLEGDTLRGGG